ncbi:NAD-dependent epimerase/dehydratase family protein [Haliangium sp.]|uniref:NAD-dependent epimerase/dehydratase family protein n=1 Tax=Haliangium sp. TaxID=2663208 RepID=UPI003D14EC9C
MKILITGARGQIGSDLVTTFSNAGYEIIATDLRLPDADHRPGVTWYALDVAQRAQVFDVVATHRPEAVFHLAAILSARGETNPAVTYEVNQAGTYYLLEASRTFGVKRFIFPSTIAVYGPGLPDPTPDEVPLHPTTMYGVTKVGGELLCSYYWQRYALDARGVRFPGLISATRPGGGTSDYALYMYVDGVRLGRYEAFCRPDTRIPLMYMPDALRAILELFQAPRHKLQRCIYNIAGFSPTAAEIATSIRRALGEVDITFAPDSIKQAILDSWPNALDDTCARADWGWKAAYDLEAMTADLIPKIRAMLADEDPLDLPP